MPGKGQVCTWPAVLTETSSASTPTVEVVPVSLDRPAGLQNIGNTCYLNSLLQYFFTIRELREVVLAFERYKDDSADSDAAPAKRVGGREISRKEIERSKRFVQHLSALFFQLVHIPESSVRPELDLAYLALVSNKDEDEATSPKEVSGASMPTGTEGPQVGAAAMVDTTMADPLKNDAGPAAIDVAGEGLIAAQVETIPEVEASPVSADSPSVLGKRGSEHLDDAEMDVDRQSRGRSEASPEKPKVDEDTNMAVDGQAAQPPLTEEPAAFVIAIPEVVEAAQPLSTQGEKIPDSETPAPPPLPPRPPAQARKATAVANSTMMFGKQNDVSEAMDNVIFQIEAALDEAKIAAEQPDSDFSQHDQQGFVQGLFYGSSRQTLEFDGSPSERRVKDETFSYLLVDVATEGRDLYDGLDASLQTSIVEVEGKQAKRTDVLTRLPPVLQIQLQRVQFDRKTGRVFKSNAHMPFPETLKMGRYLAPDEDDSEAVERSQTSTLLRRQLATAREQLVALERVDDDKV